MYRKEAVSLKDKVNDKARQNFKTFPLADVAEVQDTDNVAIPSVDGVKEAKDWVDFNEK